MQNSVTPQIVDGLTPQVIEPTHPPADYDAVHRDIVTLLENARQTAARSVNSIMTATYWLIGRHITLHEQGGQARANYGDLLIKALGKDLSRQFGRGFGWRNLTQMRTFYHAWPLDQILQTLSAKSQTIDELKPTTFRLPDLKALTQDFPLPWSAYVRLLSVKSESARQFYETEALRCGWSVRQLDRQIGSQFFERAASSSSVQPCQRTKLPCWRKRQWPNPVTS